ncbi:hypothetical protein EZV61_03900 [Corallincola luteus]|uniref:DUF4198 domain-containing protein n=1 Tax=Corallincola luteus TaxID=1775177 RepID=A0ABY2API6_9GAMM|nr:hypothetical protein [Corallincola luteus]TCI05115.1 hypothetical protein EZV61_03900 [Corallincola luteus]
MGKRKLCRAAVAGSCVAFICWLLAGGSAMAGSVNHASVTAGHDHSVGIHGMVLVKVADVFYASHLPLHGSKHAHQIIMAVDIESLPPDFINALNSQQLVTLAPEAFSLNQLQAGELLQFQATLYLGHFERGGQPFKKQVTVKVASRLLMTALQDGENGSFYQVELNRDHALLVHRIGQRPSFDQIIWVSRRAPLLRPEPPMEVQREDDEAASAPLYRLSKGGKLTRSDAENGLPGWRWQAELYLETRDFQ